jgi:hypothetical protein
MIGYEHAGVRNIRAGIKSLRGTTCTEIYPPGCYYFQLIPSSSLFAISSFIFSSAALWVRIQTSLKNIKWAASTRRGQHTLHHMEYDEYYIFHTLISKLMISKRVSFQLYLYWIYSYTIKIEFFLLVIATFAEKNDF